MKKYIMTLLALALIPVLSFAGDANQMKYVTILPSVASASATSAALDVAAYKGNSTVVVDWGTSTATNYSATVTFTHCATSGGSYTTVTNLAGTAGVLAKTGAGTGAVATYPIDLGRVHKYVKAAIAQSNETNSVGVILVAPMKSE